jgi:hypothetical protein
MQVPPLLSGPIPPFSNPPIQPQYYQPSVFVISAITLGQTTIITTTINMNYVIGQIIRLTIPEKYGCNLLNNQTGYVISLPNPNQVEVTINSTQSDPFIASPAYLPFQPKTLPQIVAVGDVNSGINVSTGRVQSTTNIPGSFINISPL